jgi:cation transport ATPase
MTSATYQLTVTELAIGGMTCPCAMDLATPTAMLTGTGGRRSSAS